MRTVSRLSVTEKFPARILGNGTILLRARKYCGHGISEEYTKTTTLDWPKVPLSVFQGKKQPAR